MRKLQPALPQGILLSDLDISLAQFIDLIRQHFPATLLIRCRHRHRLHSPVQRQQCFKLGFIDLQIRLQPGKGIQIFHVPLLVQKVLTVMLAVDGHQTLP